MKILYVAGYGRSGSTVLERVLASHPRVFGGGELNSVIDLLDPQGAGDTPYAIEEDQLWTDIADEIRQQFPDGRDVRRLQQEFQSLSSIRGYLFGHGTQRRNQFRDYIDALTNAIAARIHADADYLVDSSKTARVTVFKPLALAKVAGREVKVIHLVRDGRGCIWSVLKGSNRKIKLGVNPKVRFAGIRSSVHWLMANLGAQLYAWLLPGNYIRLRYEDFVAKPGKSLLKLSEFLDLDLSEQIQTIESGASFPATQQIAANRSKGGALVLRADEDWKSQLGLAHRLLFWLVDWPLALFYGYR